MPPRAQATLNAFFGGSPPIAKEIKEKKKRASAAGGAKDDQDDAAKPVKKTKTEAAPMNDSGGTEATVDAMAIDVGESTIFAFCSPR
jgi:hypothetical protein